MSGFSKQRRQKIIDNYLAESGANAFRPGEFIDWLADKPEHEAYAAFYAIDDAEAARAYRIELARKFVSGLRIVVSEQEVVGEDRTVTIRTTEAPRYFSPVEHRQDGGGYVAYDPSDEKSVASFRKEAATQFASWKRRYESALTDSERQAAATLQELLEKEATSA